MEDVIKTKSSEQSLKFAMEKHINDNQLKVGCYAR